jgi:hypothetical protein
MKKSKFTESQIVKALKEHESGRSARMYVENRGQ